MMRVPLTVAIAWVVCMPAPVPTPQKTKTRTMMMNTTRITVLSVELRIFSMTDMGTSAAR